MYYDPKRKGLLGRMETIVDPDTGEITYKAKGVSKKKTFAGMSEHPLAKKEFSEVVVGKGEKSKIVNHMTNVLKGELDCNLAKGKNCNTPEGYRKSFWNELVEKAAANDKASITKMQRILKGMKKLKGPLKWTGYGILGEIGFMVPFGVADYTTGKSWKRIFGNATDWGFGPMFGQSEDEEIISHIPEALKEKATGYLKAKKLHPRLEQFKDPASGSDLLYEQEDIIRGPDDQSMYASTLQGMQLDMDNIISLFKSDQDILGTEKALQASQDRIKQLEAQTLQERRDRGFIAEEGWEKNFRRGRMGGGIMGLKK